MDNTHAIPVIDTNRGIGIVPDKLTFKRNPGIIIREREKARYRLRWEIERTFSILEEILHSEHIWYVRSRNYDVVVDSGIQLHSPGQSDRAEIKEVNNGLRCLEDVWPPYLL